MTHWMITIAIAVIVIAILEFAFHTIVNHQRNNYLIEELDDVGMIDDGYLNKSFYNTFNVENDYESNESDESDEDNTYENNLIIEELSENMTESEIIDKIEQLMQQIEVCKSN